jgi:hypothetical protein
MVMGKFQLRHTNNVDRPIEIRILIAFPSLSVGGETQKLYEIKVKIIFLFKSLIAVGVIYDLGLHGQGWMPPPL